MDDMKHNTIACPPPPNCLSTPVFVIILVGERWNKRIRIPPEFVDRYIHEFQSTGPRTILQTTGGSWMVSKEYRSGGRVYLTDGWPTFVSDNNLIQGKLIVFYAATPTLFHVSLLNKYGCAKFMSPTLHCPPPVWRHLPIAVKECQKYYINLPISFMKITGLANEKKVMLINPEGVACTIELRKWRLGPGWVKFCRANSYISGDSCVLRCLTADTGTLLKAECYKV